jgi:hypothetical protein
MHKKNKKLTHRVQVLESGPSQSAEVPEWVFPL